MNQNSEVKKWRSRITPLNIVSSILFGFTIYTFIPPYHGYVGMIMIFALPFIAGVFGVYLLVKHKVKIYIWVFIIESYMLLILSLLLFNSYARYIAYHINFNL